MTSPTLAYLYKKRIAEMPDTYDTSAEIDAYRSLAWREALITREYMMAIDIKNGIKNGKEASQKTIDWVDAILQSYMEEKKQNVEKKVKPKKNKN